MSPAFVKVSGDERFHAAVEIAGERWVGLLDSGAQVTVVGPKFMVLVNSGRVSVKPSTLTVRVADGTVHKTEHMLVLPVTYQDQIRIIEAPLLPSLKHDLVLGVDFWDKFGIRPVMLEVESIEAEKQISVSGSIELSETDAKRLGVVLAGMPFCKEGPLSKTHLVTHTIDTGDAAPIKQTQYTISPYVQKEVHEEVDRLLSIGAIYPCSSPWNNPIIAVRKPTGKIRLCIDARKLNNVTVKDAYPTPQLLRILSQLTDTKFLSSIDFSDAYHQVELSPESKMKTAFSVSGKGFFAYARMPFGLCNSGATLCRLVDRVVGCDLEPHVFVYMDDVIIATKTLDHHLQILEIIAQRLSAAGLTISPTKSRFCMSRLKYLGHIISANGIEPNPENITSIKDYPAPKTPKEVRRLLGMAGWYRRFIPDFATISAPLSDLLKKGRTFVWSDRAQAALESIKAALVSSPVLATPDFSQPFILQTDASDCGIGGVLVQGTGDNERVVAYYSQKLSATQQKYQTTERECLAVIVGIEKFRAYIEGVHFTVVTDHASLQWLQNLKDPCGRLGRWALRLQPYNFTLVHRPGRMMVVADALSRSVETVDVSSFAQTSDAWYTRMREKVQQHSDKYTQYRCENGVLLKHCSETPQRMDRETWRIVVPADKRSDVLRECHDDPLSAHGGKHKTIDRVSRRYCWPKMHAQISRYVHDCEVCSANKPANVVQRAPMGSRIVASRPWQALYIDFVGPMPRSKGGFTYLLVVVDAFSKFVHVHPMRVATAKGVIQFLEKHVFLVFGVPDQLISDNGSQFTSAEYRTFLDKYRVRPFFVSRYHPQANAAEAANKTVTTAIRSYIKDKHRDWDQHLAQITCAINTSTHSATKTSPYFANFGRNMVTSGGSADISGEGDNVDEDHFTSIRNSVERNLEQAHAQSKQRYDLRSRPVAYSVGETVWKRTFVLSDASKGFAAKLAPKFAKCTVTRKIGNSSYELADVNGKSLGVFSAKDIKR